MDICDMWRGERQMEKEQLIIFCDDTACPVMPKETPDQKAQWEKDKPKFMKMAQEIHEKIMQKSRDKGAVAI